MSLRLVPVTLAQADAFVDHYHRHNDPPGRARFAVGCADDTGLVRGVAVAGNPKARMLDDGATLEIVRVCTDGARNASSMLYGACARAAKSLGFVRVITYTLDAETGASLRAAGFVPVARTRPPSEATRWDRGRHPSRRARAEFAHLRGESVPADERTEEHALLVKNRWERRWEGELLELRWPEVDAPLSLFDLEAS